MRTLADRYRDHFPALILGHTLDGEGSGRYHHAWIEVVPGTRDGYQIQPGVRSGDATVNYALEENNKPTPTGTVVWMRHRDEDGGALHFAFLAPAGPGSLSVTPPAGPGPEGGSGVDLTGKLCLSITNLEGCDCLEGEYELVWAAPFGRWICFTTAPECGESGLGVEIYLQAAEGGGYELGVGVAGTTVGTGDLFAIGELPYETEAEVTGDACEGSVRLRLTSGSCTGCDYTVTGEGTFCFGEGVTVRFGDTVAQTVVSGVCPVFSELVGGDGIQIERTAEGEITITAVEGAGSGRVRVVTGLVVERQTVYLPTGLVIDAAECRLDPAACCVGSGVAAAGCCWPAPPATLYASLYDASEDCACLEACVTLQYDEALDGWYSTAPANADCDGGVLRLRLRCREGAYELDVVDEDDVLVLSGVLDAVEPNCDPFLVAAAFEDSGGIVCEAAGTFGYFISEADCSGGGGTVAVDCCDEEMPATLYAHVTSLAAGCECLSEPTYTLSLISTAPPTWSVTSEVCGLGQIWTFSCQGAAEDDFQILGPLGLPGVVELVSADCATATFVFDIDDSIRLGCSYRLTVNGTP